jgi:hypothetical protein
MSEVETDLAPNPYRVYQCSKKDLKDTLYRIMMTDKRTVLICQWCVDEFVIATLPLPLPQTAENKKILVQPAGPGSALPAFVKGQTR